MLTMLSAAQTATRDWAQIRKVTRTTTVTRITEEDVHAGRAHSLQLHEIPAKVAIFRIHGPFLFGSTDKLEHITEQLEALPPVVILRLRNMTAIDATGVKAVEDLATRLHTSGRQLLLCGMREQPRKLMRQAKFQEHIGAKNILRNVQRALRRASELVAEPEAPRPYLAG